MQMHPAVKKANGKGVKANYYGCWNLKPKEKMLENLGRFGSLSVRREKS